LSRSERAVIRGVYRASQLSEAWLSLSKIETSLVADGFTSLSRQVTEAQKESIKRIKDYLAKSALDALVSTKVPAQQSKIVKSLDSTST
jgi:DnaJ-domain-containing protein 1